jgi:hypothetical protein
MNIEDKYLNEGSNQTKMVKSKLSSALKEIRDAVKIANKAEIGEKFKDQLRDLEISCKDAYDRF